MTVYIYLRFIMSDGRSELYPARYTERDQRSDEIIREFDVPTVEIEA